MELTDAERECRNDAADYEAERWKVHTIHIGSGVYVEYAEASDIDGDAEGVPTVNLWSTMGRIGMHDERSVDILIDALTTAREHVFGPREES